jgi:hypothetical protein
MITPPRLPDCILLFHVTRDKETGEEWKESEGTRRSEEEGGRDATS